MRIATLALMLALIGGLSTGAFAADEPILGGPCDGCEAAFVDRPTAPASVARIAPKDAPGEPMTIEGTVRRADGSVVADIVIYAYHTDAGGRYPRGSTRHGAFRNWARTDAQGHYRFDTIRPGAYPGADVPQHVHMHVIEPGKGSYYIDDIVFDDDPLLTPAQRQQMLRGRGGEGLSHPVRDAQGTWQVRRDIVLGRNISGYPD